MTVDYILYKLGDYYSTTSELVSDDDLFIDISHSDLLSYKDKNGISNLERIYHNKSLKSRVETRNDFQKELLNVNSGAKVSWSHPFTIGTLIALPKDKLNRAVAARDGGTSQVVGNTARSKSTGTLAYLSDEVDRLLNNEQYQKKVVERSSTPNNTVTKEVPRAKVRIWSRALSNGDNRRKTDDLEGRWINVSRYIQVLSTHTDEMGGNFQISLAPIQAEFKEASQGWETDRDSIDNFGEDYVAKTNIFTTNSKGEHIRTHTFFNLCLQENDLVYISFEPLELEVDDEVAILDGIAWDAAGESPFKTNATYDMIGLIDTVEESFNAQENDISISISGRDLSKLVIEDGSYMYSSLWDGHNFFLEKNNPLMKRTLGAGGKQAYNYFAEPKYRSISEAVLFIINVLANVRVVPDSSLQGSSKGSISLETVDEDEGQVKIKDVSAVEAKSAIRRLRAKAGLSESGAEEVKIVQSIFNKFVTYGTTKSTLQKSSSLPYSIKYQEYRLIDTRLGLPLETPNLVLPYRGGTIEGLIDQSGLGSDSTYLIQEILNYVDANVTDVGRETISQNSSGVWGAVKLAFDDNIKDRKLVDISMGTPDGSIIDLIFNYAQSPWVETIMDTYNKHWHMIFRMPPFDKERIKEYISMDFFSRVFIDNENVLSTELTWDTEIYSLYQLDYKAVSWGGNENLAAVIPTVPLPDYAEMYGARQWRQSSNLITVSQTDDTRGIVNRSYVRDQGIEDLAWVINTHTYLPFTRTGTITINGDRRFKKGMWVHYRPTNEIFYITGVTHSFSGNGTVDRTTVLSVRRGMVLDYVTGEKTIKTEKGNVELSYFNIVDTTRLSNFLKAQLKVSKDEEPEPAPKSDTEENFRVNREVFDFFRKRNQFKPKK